MNTSLINETNTKLKEIVENIRTIKDEYEVKLADNKSQIDQELSKVDEYKNLFYEAKKKIQKMSDDINGFEEDYRNLVEKFQDDELSNILTGVSKEINSKIKEKKRNIQKDQNEMNSLIDKAQEAKKTLVKLTSEKKALELVLRQVTDVYKYYDEEFERLINYTTDNFDNLHPDEEAFEINDVDEDINFEDIEIDEKEEIVTDEDVNKEVVELQEENKDEDEQQGTDFSVLDQPTYDEEETNDEEIDFSKLDEDMPKDDEVENTSVDDIAFNIENLVLNDDLEDDDEESIESFLNKDEKDLDEE
ncbi:MAG: hypothetical protein K6C11_04435 [Bacilli bacterium]|nr:hypothetical protein [Bacilli bacterium]